MQRDKKAACVILGGLVLLAGLAIVGLFAGCQTPQPPVDAGYTYHGPLVIGTNSPTVPSW